MRKVNGVKLKQAVKVGVNWGSYHITLRGNSRKAIYLEEVDFEIFLDVLDLLFLQHE